MPKRLFLLCFAVVGLSGVAVALWGNATGDFDHDKFVEGAGRALRGFVVLAIEAVVFRRSALLG